MGENLEGKFEIISETVSNVYSLIEIILLQSTRIIGRM